MVSIREIYQPKPNKWVRYWKSTGHELVAFEREPKSGPFVKEEGERNPDDNQTTVHTLTCGDKTNVKTCRCGHDRQVVLSILIQRMLGRHP